jgi:hypothetical protein
MRAVRKSSAAARMCSPIVVRVQEQRERSSAPATTIATIVILRTSTPPTVTGSFSEASDGGARRACRRGVHDQRDAWSRNAIANVVTSITAGDCAAQRPEDDAVHREREQRRRPRSTARCCPRPATPR